MLSLPVSQPRCCWCGRPFYFGAWADLACWYCVTPACQERTRPHVITAQGRAIYVPLPKQVELIETVLAQQVRWLLYGGAAGGAKSHAIRWVLYRQCLSHPGFRGLLLRRTYPELEKTHMRSALFDASLFGARALLSSNPPTMHFDNGSILEFGHCQDEKNVASFLSAEYDLIAFDELVTFEERMVMLLASRCRVRRGSGLTPLILGGTNPGGVGSLWVKSRWIDRAVDERLYPYYDPETHRYIPALLEDNPYIDETYEAFLMGLDEARRRAYRYGDWDVFEGQYFTEFRAEDHVQALDLPADLPRLGGLDWGYAQPGIHLWAVALPDGRLHIDREWVFQERLAQDVAHEILQVNQQERWTESTCAADPAMWIRLGQVGESIAETMIQAGLPLHRAHHERVNGWHRVRHWLAVGPRGPALTMDPSCRALRRSFTSVVYDTQKLDVDTAGYDHPVDAARYLLMSRPAPFLPAPEPEPGPGTVGALFREARGAAGAGLLGRGNLRTP